MKTSGHDGESGGFFRSRANMVLIGFLAIASFFLVAEHRAHLLPYAGYLFFLIFLACPLMHFFMHGGHGGSHDAESADDAPNQQHRH
jgi:hypothetical protein